MSVGMGVIGAGLLGSRHARVWAERPDTSLIAVMDVDEGRARKVALDHGARWTTDVTEMLADPAIQAVSVATPDHAHFGPVMEALKAGCDVLVEKPLAMSVEEARAMVEEARRHQRILQVNLSQRFVEEYQYIKAVIASGILGAVAFVESIRHDRIDVPTEMLAGWAEKSSPVFFLTSHDLDLLRWYLEAEPASAVGFERRTTLVSRGIATHDGLLGLVTFTNGTVAHFHTSWIHSPSYPVISDTYLEVTGSDGVLTYQSRGRRLEIYAEKAQQHIQFEGPGTVQERQGRLVGAFVDSLASFVGSVKSREQPMTSGVDSLRAIACQVALLESAAQGQGVLPVSGG